MPAFFFFCFFFLSACTNQAPTMPDSLEYHANADSQNLLRYPMSGSPELKEKKLYYMNQPSVMQSFQEWNRAQIRASVKGQARDDDFSREIPKQRSPFRQ